MSFEKSTRIKALFLNTYFMSLNVWSFISIFGVLCIDSMDILLQIAQSISKNKHNVKIHKEINRSDFIDH